MKKSTLSHVITLTLSSAVLSAALASPGAIAGAYDSINPDGITPDDIAYDSRTSDNLASDLTVQQDADDTPLTDTSLITSISSDAQDADPVENLNDELNTDPVTSGDTSAQSAADNNETSSTFTSEMGLGIGVGAATGGLVAGPVGLIVGGIVGAFVGSNHEIADTDESSVVTSQNLYENNLQAESKLSAEETDFISVAEQDSQIHLAQSGPIAPVINVEDTIVDVLIGDLSFDVYFRSGSTEIEDFYPARLKAVSQLLDEVDELEVHLDGYADRRGDKDKNIALSNERINSVRQALIDSGVDENRIISKAYGEMKMVSAAGDLEAYTFDRKVVIRFERASSDSLMTMNKALSSDIIGSDMVDDAPGTDPLIANTVARF